MPSSFGLMHFWQSGDTVSHIVFMVLLFMSISTWYFILYKSWFLFKMRHNTIAPQHFWQASSLEQGMNKLKLEDKLAVYWPLLEKSLLAIQHSQQAPSPTIAQRNALEAQTTQIIRQQLQKTTQQLESGQTWLGSISATAPFVGLLGTVWGIFHALINLSDTTQLQLSQITGPVGEALVMTAFGLAVAIPAALAFNAFNRTNRLIFDELEGFAYDVHAYISSLTPGGR